MAVVSAPALRMTTSSGAVECDWGVFCHGCQGTYPGQHNYTWESFLLHVARRGLQHGIGLTDPALRHAIDSKQGKRISSTPSYLEASIHDRTGTSRKTSDLSKHILRQAVSLHSRRHHCQ